VPGIFSRILGRQESPERKAWLAHSRALLDKVPDQLDAAPFAYLDGSPGNREEKYRRLLQTVPWGTVRGEVSWCDVPRLIRALVSMPAELAALLILDIHNKDWRLTETAMEALTSRPQERQRTEDQLAQEFRWQQGKLLQKIAAIVACVLCYKESPVKAKELLEDIGDLELKRAVVKDIERNHAEICELIR